MSDLKDRVLQALDLVVDPCSVSAGAPLSVIDMGMVLDVSLDASGGVDISMRPTSAMCTLIVGIVADVESRVAALSGVTDVRVSLSSATIWTEADLTDRGREIIRKRRQQSRNEVRVRPHEWKTRNAKPQGLPA